MSTNELIKTESELKQIADLLSQEVQQFRDENVVSRYIRIITDSVIFVNGQKNELKYSQ